MCHHLKGSKWQLSKTPVNVPGILILSVNFLSLVNYIKVILNNILFNRALRVS